jgi:hypothetical protein
VLSEGDINSVMNGRPGLKGGELATDSKGNPRSRVATLGSLGEVCTRLTFFEPSKLSMIMREG